MPITFRSSFLSLVNPSQKGPHKYTQSCAYLCLRLFLTPLSWQAKLAITSLLLINLTPKHIFPGTQNAHTYLIMQNAFSPPRFFRVFTVPTLFKVQAQSFLWPGKVNSTVSPCKAKNKLYNSRIQWHRTFTTPILKGRKWRQKKKKDRTTGRLLSRRESNSQRCNSISSCVKHLQHPYREDHPTAVHPGSVFFIYGLCFPWKCAKFLASPNRVTLHLWVLCTTGANWRVFWFCHWLPSLPRFPLKSECILKDLILWHFSTQEKSTPCIQSLSDWGL